MKIKFNSLALLLLLSSALHGKGFFTEKLNELGVTLDQAADQLSQKFNAAFGEHIAKVEQQVKDKWGICEEYVRAATHALLAETDVDAWMSAFEEASPRERQIMLEMLDGYQEVNEQILAILAKRQHELKAAQDQERLRKERLAKCAAFAKK